MKKLTKAQREALVVLSTHEEPIRASTKTHADVSSYVSTISGRVVWRLEKARLIRYVCLLSNGEEVKGADLGRLFGKWVRRYAITDAGRDALKDGAK